MLDEKAIRLSTVSRGWDAFDRLDEGAEDHVLTFDVLVNKPEEFCIARYGFRTGVGYEYTFSVLVGEDEVEAALTFYAGPGLRWLTQGDAGHSPAGYPLTCVRLWLDQGEI